MFFSDELIRACRDKPALERKLRRANLFVEQLHNSHWLIALHQAIKEHALSLCLAATDEFINVLYVISRMPSHQLPPHSDIEACMDLLHAAYVSQKSVLYRNPVPIIHSATALDAQALPGQSQGIYSRLSKSGWAAQTSGVQMIRGRDKTYTRNQSLIYAPIIQRNRIAVQQLVTVASECSAIFSLERGGALWGDYIALMSGGRVKSMKIPKPARNPVRAFTDHIGKYINALRATPGHADQLITIGIAETMVSGGSANRVLDAARSITNSNPGVDIKLLFARHTIHRGDDILPPFSRTKLRDFHIGSNEERKEEEERKESTPLPEEAKKFSIFKSSRPDDQLTIPVMNAQSDVEMFIANAQYLLGEDIDYQLSYNSRSASEPIIVFDQVRGQLKGICIKPEGGHTAREMLIRLILGFFDELLAEEDLSIQ